MKVKNGDKVKVDYVGKFADGSIFDSSKGRQPLEFIVGAGSVIPGFENAVLDKNPGDKVTVVIPPEDAYGQVDPELIFTVERSRLPDNITPEVGTQLQLSNEQGQMDVVITEVGPDSITLDANHPLAGKELRFDIDVLEVTPAKD